MNLSILIFIVTLLATAVIFIATLINKKTSLDREKTSPFECGFDPFSSTRIPFSLRFFMITIVFLIFDVEIALILPLPLLTPVMSSAAWILISMAFIMTLILGLIHEWNFGSLDWSY